MKILLTLFVLLFSSSVFGEMIYCYKSTDNETLQTSSRILYFQIDNKNRQITKIKEYSEYMYEGSLFDTHLKKISPPRNYEVLYFSEKDIRFKEHLVLQDITMEYFLDRIAGILITKSTLPIIHKYICNNSKDIGW